MGIYLLSVALTNFIIISNNKWKEHQHLTAEVPIKKNNAIQKKKCNVETKSVSLLLTSSVTDAY